MIVIKVIFFNLTDPEILKFKNDKNKLPNLELFYIGNNKFKFNEINTNINDKYEFFSLKEIGISRNFFNFLKIEIFFIIKKLEKSLKS